jgi:predicted enzyme related to lactoylglutathione lyase
MTVRFVHVNLVARDWRRLAAFYQEVFDCVPVPPERHLRGDWLDRATGLPGAALDGMHLRLPAADGTCVTLEVFQYSDVREQTPPSPNRQGFGHIAFEVDNVPAAVESVLAHGGSLVGEMVVRPIEGVGTITFAYARDPEGNIIELQQWDRSQAWAR